MRGARAWAAAVTAVAAAFAVSAAPSSARAGAAAAAGDGPGGLAPARALLVYEQDTGRVVFAENGNAELPIASTTKLMTAFVTVEQEHPGRILTEQRYAAGPGESLAGVPPGSRLSLADMLRAMLLPSGNDVAHSLAIDVGGTVSGFVAQMNFWAGVLKLGRTRFTTPVGLDQPGGNYSTALDLARLTTVLLRDPLVAAIVREPRAQLGDGLVVDNRNDLLARNPWVVGVKTGSTLDAGYCMVGAARRHGVRVISVVLGAPSVAARDSNTLALLRYGLSRYRRARIARAGQVLGMLAIKGRHRRVAVVAARSASLVIGASAQVHAALRLPARLVGPLPAGARVGSIVVRADGRRVLSVPLVTATPVPRPAAVGRRDDPLLWIAAGGGVGMVLVGCSLPLMRKRSARATLEVS
jgi:serine-type D-Ala-D-Ala carboxypeptidase (penicillin-binding protein 5/6)